MREIRFRAWDPINKEMWPFVYPTWNGDVEGKKTIQSHTYTEVELMPTEGDNQPVLMQYTGYEDATLPEPVPVFDGDILEWSEGYPAKTKRGVVEWPTFYKDEPGWMVTNTIMGFAYLSDNYNPVVVGNIYENPELLQPPTKGL